MACPRNIPQVRALPMVGRVGLEPTTYGLKVRYSAIELAPLAAKRSQLGGPLGNELRTARQRRSGDVTRRVWVTPRSSRWQWHAGAYAETGAGRSWARRGGRRSSARLNRVISGRAWSSNRFAEAATRPVCSTSPQRTDVRGKPGLL